MKKKQWRGIIIPAVFFWAILSETGCLAGARLLSGHRAEEHIGSMDELARKGFYAVLELRRRTPHPLTQAWIDAVVFFKGNGRFVLLRQKDSDHRFKLNVPEGSNAATLTADTVSFFQDMIDSNKLRPHAVLDRDGNELFIVYCAFTPCLVNWSREKNGMLVVAVEEPLRRIFLPRLPSISRLIPKK